ncbi:MAG: hypothetical protein N2117_09935 [Anaerolineales bacterium]|nr:hypothetical protein [Anaerolineales bacterium]MCX7755549.1 hypothetical protein [Anaerolineales bacterium]MDW8278412.1 hypothetical protein [Anaerolineales bacterium]
MTDSRIERATIETATDLKSIAQSPSVRDLSRLSLPEIEAVVEVTSQIIPAGNIPGMILNGLTRLSGQRLPQQTVQKHITALFSALDFLFAQVTSGAVLVAPAAVIWGYQNLLKLAGKDPESAFPEGIWQFYVDYALREDTARHVIETHGFDTLLYQHGIRLNELDRLTAWVMAAISVLNQYDALLEIEWRERVATAILRELTRSLPQAARYARIYREWEIQRPYRRGAEAANYDYPDYRRIKFQHFLQEAMRPLPADLRAEWQRRMSEAERELPAYQRQMSILAYLEPGQYGETRTPYNFEQAHIGIILRGNYYLLPVCAPGSDQPLNAETVRAQLAALLALPGAQPARLTELARIKRSALPGLFRKLSPAVVEELSRLRFAPILINADTRPAHLPLTELRQAERGIGSHALTLFLTDSTAVFDLSHIFFDGILGAALAEILTNEALSWAAYLHTLPATRPAVQRIFHALAFPLTPADHEQIRVAPRVTPEAGAESDKINLRACLNLRHYFKQRNDALKLTVNDLLVLYRAIHAARYQPSPELEKKLEKLAANRTTRALADQIRAAIEESRRQNPSMLIPMDASRQSPRDRLYPLSMEVPLAELDLLNLHARAIQTLNAYEGHKGDRSALYAQFDEAQRTYLATLAGFSAIFDRLKEIAIRGESASVAAIKALAHMPPALQHLLDQIPSRFELLNNVLKGREVFSNVGAVVPSSTLRRFVTAKDDNEQKQLVWGVITDARGVLRISLRDFRPHVAALQAAGRADLAHDITQDYLDSYVNGFNNFIFDLQRITLASRKTLPER